MIASLACMCACASFYTSGSYMQTIEDVEKSGNFQSVRAGDQEQIEV